MKRGKKRPASRRTLIQTHSTMNYENEAPRDLTELVIRALEKAEEQEESLSLSVNLPRTSGPGSKIKTTVWVAYERGLARIEDIEYDPDPHVLIADDGDWAEAVDEGVMSDYAELVGLTWEEALETAIFSMVEPGNNPEVQFFSVEIGQGRVWLEDRYGNDKEYRLNDVPLWFCDGATYGVSRDAAQRVEEAMREELAAVA